MSTSPSTSPSTRPHPGGLAVLAGREVARVGYGAMQLGDGGPDAEAAAVAVLRAAVERGVDHVDTAEFYGAGVVNQRIRAALHPYPEHLVLVSKAGATSDPAGQHGLRPAQKPAELRAEVEANLRTLGAERLDVVNIRHMNRPPGLVAEGDQVVDFDDQIAEMVALREAGKIGGFGLSHVDADELRHALPAGVACVQNADSLVDRSSEDVLDLCREHDVAWVPFFPLGSAFEGFPKVADLPAVREVATRLGATPAQVGLAWVLARDPRSLLIPGTRSVAHLDENLAAGALVLSADDLATLDAPV